MFVYVIFFYIVMIWVGGFIVDRFIMNGGFGWRWGMGMWVIVMFVIVIFLIFIFIYN